MKRRARGRLVAIGSALIGLTLAHASTARAEATRVALIIANDAGHPGDVKLRYAESDATRLATVLTRLGGFAPDATFLLRGGSIADIRQELATVDQRLRSAPGEHLVFLYYSGHADAEVLHVGPESFPLVELKAAVLALPAAARVIVVDACQSGAITRVKGGRPAVPFAVQPDEGLPSGLAILASTDDAELAQESDEIGSSFFTHYFLVGLLGGADTNQDGRVSLGESFNFSSRRTLAATVGSAAGPQHPTYRFDLLGQQDLVLTRPGAAGTGFGQLAFDQPGRFFVRRSGDPVVMEIVSHGRERIALEPGRYEVANRLNDQLEIAEVDIHSNAGPVTMSGVPARRVAFGRVVRKGGVILPKAFSVALLAGGRSDVAGLGPAMSAALVGRLDSHVASVELRVGAERAELAGSPGTATSAATTDVLVSVAALRARDFRHVTLAAGVEAGGAGFSQRFDGASRGGLSFAASLGPTALVELPIGARFCLRADVTAPLYLLRERQADGGDQLRARFAARLWAGAGVYF
ncbi:MAG TPA: caspase family protein [Polyangia bacterium]|nr:caspase family protein [Polyangia bacterium]